MKPKYTILFMAAILLAGMAFAGNPRQESARKKARYYWMEGAKANASGDLDQAYELYRYAHQIDPTYPEATQKTAFCRIIAFEDATPEDMEVLKKYVDLYPGDVPEAELYANLAGNLGMQDEELRILNRLLRQNPNQSNYLLSIAGSYMGSGDNEIALDTLYSYVRREGVTPKLAEHMAMLKFETGDTIGTEALINRFIQEHPTVPDYEIIKSDYFYMLHMPDSALNAVLRAEQIAPDNGRTKLILADYYKELGDSLAFETKIEEALLCYDLDMDNKIDIIIEYLQPMMANSEELDKAQRLFDILAEQYPREKTIMELTASYYMFKHDWDKAQETLGYALDMEPTDVNLWNQLMGTDNSSKNYKKAEEDYNRALQYVDTPSTDMQFTLALSYVLDKRQDKATDLFSQMLQETDSTLTVKGVVDNTELKNSLDYESLIRVSDIYTTIGDMFAESEDIQDAYNGYINALYFNPENALAMNNYAYRISLQEDGDLEKAAKLSSRSITYAPDNATFYDTYAWINYRMGDYNNARILQAKAIEMLTPDQESYELYDHYGDILEKCGRHEEALENWKKALELEPDNEKIKEKIKH